MQNIKLQIGCLAVLLYVAVVYFRGCKKYRRKITSSHFLWLLVLGIAEVVFDGATAWTVNHLETVPPAVNMVLHALFLSSLDATIFALFTHMLYMTDLKPKSKKAKALVYAPFALNLVVALLFIGKLEYIRGRTTNYSMGISAYTCFAMVAVYFLLTVLVFAKRWNYIKSAKRGGIITILAAFIITTTIQMVFPETLISSLGVAIVVLGLYLNSEDPALKELGEYYSETIIRLANLIEARDGSTGGHIKRTSRYAVLIAEELRNRNFYRDVLTKDFIDNLLYAAPMHDVGKIAAPDAILQKPGKLTDEEYAEMKRHTENGGKIVRETFGDFFETEYCEMAYEVARHHHEKWNGRGYPDGLKGKEIPLAARIMAVADVFDAVSEKRCYRDALPLEKCFEIIERGSGQDFDPIIADVFLELRGEVEAAHKSAAHGG